MKPHIEVIWQVSKAESTIAWFCSGVKQPITKNKLKIFGESKYEFDWTSIFQQAINMGGAVYVPSYTYRVGGSW